jgi:hypothetical protein
MNARRVQSINPNDPMALQKVIEALEVSEGIRGKPDDRKPTVKEVRAMLAGSSGSNASIAGFDSSSGTISTETPTKPTGLFLKSLIDSLVIGWDIPNYSGHSGSEVFRSLTNQLADSELIGHAGANSFIDWTANADNTYYYFVRHKQVYNLGGATGPLTGSIEGKRIKPSVPPEIKSGTINTEFGKVVTFDAQLGSRKTLISLKAVFYSEIGYDFTLLDIIPETGNSVGVEIQRNGSVVSNAVASKIQTSSNGAYGQKKFMHLLQFDFVDQATSGDLDYTLTASRLFPSNTDTFELSYSIHLI